MKIYLKRTITILLSCILMLLSVFFSGSINTDAQAASAKWKKACKAYKTYLTKNQSKFKAQMGDFWTQNQESYKKANLFLIVDLDKNGVPELVVNHPYAYKMDSLYVYTYRSGKVVQVKDTSGKKDVYACIHINCNANGWYHVYKCKKNHLHTDWSAGGMMSKDSTYIVKNGKLKLYARGEVNSEIGFKSYEINGKKVSAKKYNTLIKKCGKKITIHNNTKANRKKYLK